MQKTLLQAFLRIKSLRKNQDPNLDLRQAIEELGELAKELRKLDDTSDPVYKELAQVEAIDAMIAVASAYVGLNGSPISFLDQVHYKLDKWEEEERRKALC